VNKPNNIHFGNQHRSNLKITRATSSSYTSGKNKKVKVTGFIHIPFTFRWQGNQPYERGQRPPAKPSKQIQLLQPKNHDPRKT
jgi:hypothetical protein